jgi:hypothetical protein
MVRMEDLDLLFVISGHREAIINVGLYKGTSVL